MVGAKVPASLAKPKLMRATAGKIVQSLSVNHVDLARIQFQLAADNGCDLGLKWLRKLDDDAKIEKEK